MADKDKTEARASIEASTVMYVEKSAYDSMAARVQKLEAALREVRPKLGRVRELLKPAYTNQAYIMIEELLKGLAEQEKEG